MESANLSKRPLPSDLSQILTVTRYETLKYLRSKRIYGIAVIVILIFVAYLAVPPLLGDDYPDSSFDIVSFFVSMVTLLVVVIASLFAGDAVVSEYQQRTGYLLFPNPVRKSTLFTGKYLAAMLMSALVLGIYYACTAVVSLALTGEVVSQIGASFGLALLYTAAAIAFGFLLSSAMKSGTAAIVLLFLTLLVLMDIVTLLLVVGNIDPTFVLTVAGDSLYFVLEDPYPSGDMVPELVPAITCMVAYLVGCYAIGYVLFRRREMVS
jgi:ABC-2 type transport system permease protein